MGRRCVKKRLSLTIIICILSAGIVLANSGCLLNCCVHCKSQSSHHGSTPSGHDSPHDCSSDSKRTLCHQLLNFIAVEKNNDLSTEFVEEKFTALNLDAAAVDGFFLNRSNHYFDYLKTLQIKIPSMPLYLSNLSLLF